MRQLLQPIAAFVYCNRQVPPAGATRLLAAGLVAPGLHSAHDDANTFDIDRLLNPALSLKLFLFHFITEPRAK